MKDLLQPTGNTPFEIAEAKALANSAHVRAAISLQELVDRLDECDAMINKYKQTTQHYNKGRATKDDLETDLLLATSALKERKETLQSIDDLAAVMSVLFNLEA